MLLTLSSSDHCQTNFNFFFFFFFCNFNFLKERYYNTEQEEVPGMALYEQDY